MFSSRVSNGNQLQRLNGNARNEADYLNREEIFSQSLIWFQYNYTKWYILSAIRTPKLLQISYSEEEKHFGEFKWVQMGCELLWYF